jgi:hypothetical protein
MTDRANEPIDPQPGDEVGNEGGKTAPGDAAGSRGQLDGAGGGYGSQSGKGTSGGSGDGDPVTGPSDATSEKQLDDGTATGATGATQQGPTDWLRGG